MAGKYIEKIPAGAISEIIPEAIAIVINITGNDHVYQALSQLYNHSSYRVYLSDIDSSQLTDTIALCASIGLRCFVVCGEEFPKNILYSMDISSASLISAGSDQTEREILDHILASSSARNFSHIGFQTYMYDPNKLARLRGLYFEDMRLGMVRENIRDTEPLLRSMNHSFIDLNSVRCSDLSDNLNGNPNGLYAEEICQLARYLGMSLSLRQCFLFGGKSNSVQLTAQILWHIFEGLASNIYEDPSDPKREDLFNRKIVQMGEEGHDLVFISSKTTNRWWIEIASSDDSTIHYIPCSYSEYNTAKSGEIPLRWLFFYQKTNSWKQE